MIHMTNGLNEKRYEILKNTRYNFFVNSANAAFYTVAMSFASIITLLPLFIQKLGGTNLQIGLVPAIAFLGYQIPGIFTANHIENLQRKLSFVQKITLVERTPFIILALSCIFVAKNNPVLTIYIALLCLVFITFTSGAISPAWLSYVIKVTPGSKLGTFFALGSGIGGLMGIGASIMASWFLAKYPFPLNFFYCFLWASIAVFISYYFTLIGKEPSIQNERIEKQSLAVYFKNLPAILKEDKNFLHYIFSRNFQCLGSMATTFFAVYAIKILHFEDKFAGIFLIFLLASQSITFFLWGYIGDHYRHKIVLVIGSIGLLLSSVLILISKSIYSLFVIFILMGFYYSAYGSSGLAILNRWAPEGKYPTYIALTNSLTALSAFIAPIIGGKIADVFGFSILFWIATIFSAFGFIWILFFTHEGQCSE